MQVETSALRSMLAGCGGGLTSLQLNGCVGVGGEALVGLGAACPRLARLNLRGLTLQDCHLRDLVRAGMGAGWGGAGCVCVAAGSAVSERTSSRRCRLAAPHIHSIWPGGPSPTLSLTSHGHFLFRFHTHTHTHTHTHALSHTPARPQAADCSTLQSLSLAWCTKITDAGLAPLVERNPGLQVRARCREGWREGPGVGERSARGVGGAGYLLGGWAAVAGVMQVTCGGGTGSDTRTPHLIPAGPGWMSALHMRTKSIPSSSSSIHTLHAPPPPRPHERLSPYCSHEWL